MTRMTEPDAVLTNGRYELPPAAGGVLVLADPPEAGWRLELATNDRTSESPTTTTEGDGT